MTLLVGHNVSVTNSSGNCSRNQARSGSAPQRELEFTFFPPDKNLSDVVLEAGHALTAALASAACRSIDRRCASNDSPR